MNSSAINKTDTLLIYEPCDTFYQLNHHKQKISLFTDFCTKALEKRIEKNFKNIIHIKISKDQK